MLEIPVANQSFQTFQCALDDRSLTFTLSYNSRASVWTLSLQDSTQQEDFIEDIVLVFGQDLLEPYVFSSLGHLFLVGVGKATTAPAMGDLGVNAFLMYASDEEWGSFRESSK